MRRLPAATVLLAAVLLLAGCARNNLLLGEVHADVGGHATTVTDCFRVDLPHPRTLDMKTGEAFGEYTRRIYRLLGME